MKASQSNSDWVIGPLQAQAKLRKVLTCGPIQMGYQSEPCTLMLRYVIPAMIPVPCKPGLDFTYSPVIQGT